MKPPTKHPIRNGLLPALSCLALSADAAVLIDLDATSLPIGPLPTWLNVGTIPGDFTATGAPAVTLVGGVKAVTLAGGADFYTGPVAPSTVTGINPSRTIEVWANNPSVVGEETLVAWGRRDGPEGTNLAFNYGVNGSFGAVGHWGAPDLGWFNAGGAPPPGVWHHLVYTYDGGGAAGAGTTRVYADGVLMNSEVLGTLDTHDGLAFVIGGQNNGAGTPVGFNSGLSIARVRVHDEALTGPQIAAKYAAELPEIYPTAYLAGSRIIDTSTFAFTINDRAPTSVTSPSTFSVSVGGVRAGWQVPGGEGVINGSITTPALTVPNAGPVELTLKHRYNFEGDGTAANAFDGGVIQVSINGSEFATLDEANFTQNGYFASPIIGTGVLNGSLAFNGVSPGFGAGTLITSIATIPGVSPSNTLQLRFLGAWDEGFTPGGTDWEIAGVSVKAGAVIVLNQDFTGGNGGFTAESTGGAATWNFIPGTQPTLGLLLVTKTGGVTTLTQPIQWATGRDYAFTLSGEDTNGADLVYQTLVTTPGLPLAAPRTWPASIPGPAGTANAWGVRTYLNEGLNAAEDLTAALDFLAAAEDRTPALTPDTVVDSQEPNLNFFDPTSGGPVGVIGCRLPFPGDALSTSTNGGTARDDNHVVTSAHGSVRVDVESDYTFNLRGDDGFMFRIKAASGPHPKFIAVGGFGSVDQDAQNILYFPTGTGDVNTRGIIHLTPGIYSLEYATWEGGGGFWYQVSSAQGFFPNNEDTDGWRAIGYTSTRTTPIPYPSMVGDWTVLSTLPGALAQFDLEGADAAVDAAVLADAAAATSMWPEINFQDPGTGASTSRLAGDSPWPRDTPANDDNFAMRMSGTLHIPEAGNYLIGFQGDDGSRLTVGGAHAGFSALVENVTNAGAIGRGTTIAVNSGSLGAAGNFNPQTSAIFERPGALAGSPDTGISTAAADGQRMRVPYTAALNPAGAFTAEIWVKPAAEPAGLTCPLSSGNFGDPRSGWLIYQDSPNGWNFRGYINSVFDTAFSVTGGDTIVVDQWYHLAVTWNGADARIYVNGVLDPDAEATGITNYVPTSDPAAVHGRLHIGSRADNAFGWSGDADELAIYPTALDAVTIASHYANGNDAARTEPYATLVQASAPLGYWRLNETIQPRVDLGSIITDVPAGDSSTVGRIFLAIGDYPISATFWENGGGASFEIFATRETLGGCVPVQPLRNGGFASIPDSSGLPLVPQSTPPTPPELVGGLTINPDTTLSLTFRSVPSATYTLQNSTTLTSWQDVLSNILATGTTTTVTGVAGDYFFYSPGEPGRYYRIKANP